MWQLVLLIQDEYLDKKMKQITLFFYLSLLMAFSCKKEPTEERVDFIEDPSFQPQTSEFKFKIKALNEVPCMFENNFLRVGLDSLPHSTYRWSMKRNGNELLLSNKKSHLITISGDYKVRYTFLDGQKSRDTTIYFTIDYCPVELVISDAFSPNGDGDFDYWKVHSKGVARFNCVIKNLDGNLVFSTTNPILGWNGNRNGVKMPSGTYEYSVRGAFKNGVLFEYHGALELIR